MIGQTQDEQHIGKMIRKFGGDRISQVAQTTSYTGTSSSMEHQWKQSTNGGYRGLEMEGEVHLLGQISGTSKSINNFQRQQTDQFGKAHENGDTRSGGHRHGCPQSVNVNRRGEKTTILCAVRVGDGTVSCKNFFASVRAVRSIEKDLWERIKIYV